MVLHLIYGQKFVEQKRSRILDSRREHAVHISIHACHEWRREMTMKRVKLLLHFAPSKETEPYDSPWQCIRNGFRLQRDMMENITVIFNFQNKEI